MTVLAGRVCVVTGASSGIGRAVALSLARAGGNVWAIGRDERRLNELDTDIESSDGRILPVSADLELEAGIRAAAKSVLEESEVVDVLVHSAGSIELGSADALTVGDFDRQYRVNLRAPFALTRALLPALEKAQGHIVFVNSSAGIKASASNLLYSATKHGLKALADGFRDEVNPRGVRVTTVYLGRTATPMQAAIHEHEGKTYAPETLVQTEDAAKVVLGALELDSTAEMTDVHVRPSRKPPS